MEGIEFGWPSYDAVRILKMIYGVINIREGVGTFEGSKAHRDMFLLEYSWGITTCVLVQKFLDECWDCIPDIGWDMLLAFLIIIMIGRRSHVYSLVRFVGIGVRVEELLKTPFTC